MFRAPASEGAHVQIPFWQAGNALLIVLLLTLSFIVLMFQVGWMPTYTSPLGVALVWLQFFMIIALGVVLWPTTSCSSRHVHVVTRERLRCFWFCLRGLLLIYAVLALLSGIRPLFLGYQLVFSGADDIKLASIVIATVTALVSAVLTPAMRGRFQMWLGSRFLTTTGDKEQEVSLVSSLFQGRPALEVYLTASANFCGLPVDRIPQEGFFGAEDEWNPRLADQVQRHGSPVRALREATEPAALGGVAAFVCYSWRDDPTAQLAQLHAWAAEQPTAADGRPPKVWIDRCCLNTDDAELGIACIPIHVSGCQRFLVLAGPTWASRLWCALELFTFLRMRGDSSEYKGRIDLRLAVPSDGSDVARAEQSCDAILGSFSAFNASKAQCAQNNDRQRILAAIETAFGSTQPFSKLVRSILRDKVATNCLSQTANSNAGSNEAGQDLERSYLREAPAAHRLNVSDVD
jgi:hypothetical protein